MLLDNYLGKNTRVSEKDMGDGTKQTTLWRHLKKFKWKLIKVIKHY